jgi:hypothetical protein
MYKQLLGAVLLGSISVSASFTTSVDAATCATFSTNMSYGSRGVEVPRLQQFLIGVNLLSFDSATGFFGRLTESAVQSWQRSHGIVSSGNAATTGYGAVGARTRVSINGSSCTTVGSSGIPGTTGSTGTSGTVSTGGSSQSTGTSGTNGTLGVGSTSGASGIAGAQQPLIGAFRWDAWFPSNAILEKDWTPPSLFTDMSYRMPSYGWFDADSSVTKYQAVMDQEINDAADHGLDFWAFDDYKMMNDVPLSLLKAPLTPLLDVAFQEYLASPYKSKLKFALATGGGNAASAAGTIGGDPSYFRTTYIPYLVKEFKDPQYLKVSGNRPVLFWFDDSSSWANFPAWDADLAYLNKLTEAAGLGDPMIINTTMDFADAQSHHLQGMTTYGVMGNGANPSCGSSHCSFASQMTKDESNWSMSAQSGLLSVPGLTSNNDSRAFANPSYGFYVDQPTYTQWEQEVKDAFTFMTSHVAVTNPPIAVVYAWDELTEAGPGIIPTVQNGTMYLDAIKAVKTGNYPNTYQDMYNGDNSAIVLSAAAGTPSHWTNYAPVSGNFNNDEEISQGIGESASLTVDNSTGFVVKGSAGPNRGKVQVFIDGVSQGVIDLSGATWVRAYSFFKSSVLTSGTHTLKIVNVSDDVSHSQVGIDEIVVSKQRAAAAVQPTINSFTSLQPVLQLGQSATQLTWSVSNATSVSIGGIGAVSNSNIINSTTVSPSQTTTYTLTATNAAGSASAQTTISVPVTTPPNSCPHIVMLSCIYGYHTVNNGSDANNCPTQSQCVPDSTPAMPAITTFGASQSTITSGQPTTLSWSITGATSISINGVGSVTGTSISVSPTQTTTYTITATNSSGSVTAQTTVTVNPIVSASATFTANGSNSITVHTGDPITYAWSSIGGVSANSSYRIVGLPNSNAWVANTLSGQRTDIATADQVGHTYVITYAVTDGNGQTTNASVNVTVIQ